MALEGNIRDLGLTEVFQLLALGRKTGTLHCHAPLQGRHAHLCFLSGAIVDAEVAGVDRARDAGPPRRRVDDASAIQDAVLDVLLWRDGQFRFAPGETTAHATAVRLPVEPMLMQAAMRAEVWGRIESRVPHAKVIPTFVDIEPQQLPLLKLTPPQWDILTRVDGTRDLLALAAAMQREVTDVAELVHDLMGAGLLTLREGQSAPRQNPTPPATPVFEPLPAVNTPVPYATAVTPNDLWVPTGELASAIGMPGEHDEDSLFDPVELGVFAPDGLPRRATPWRPPAPVAPAPAEPSLPREQERAENQESAEEPQGLTLCQQGDELARRGDLVGAMALWNAALRASVPVANAERVREAVALAARLHALLHP